MTRTSAPSPSLLIVFKKPFSPPSDTGVTGRGRALNARQGVMR